MYLVLNRRNQGGFFGYEWQLFLPRYFFYQITKRLNLPEILILIDIGKQPKHIGMFISYYILYGDIAI